MAGHVSWFPGISCRHMGRVGTPNLGAHLPQMGLVAATGHVLQYLGLQVNAVPRHAAPFLGRHLTAQAQEWLRTIGVRRHLQELLIAGAPTGFIHPTTHG
eukprot:6029544-Amphidinium_carterae.2